MLNSSRSNSLQDTLEAVKRLRESRKVTRPTLVKSASPWKNRSIKITPELERIVAIPRRDWEAEAEELSRELTPLLRTTSGTQMLYPVQAQTLCDLYTLYPGVIGIIRVGGGKSLICFLAPYVVRAFRPLLLVPGNLVEKTRRHLLKDRYNWEISRFIRVESYEMLGHPNHGGLLYGYKPDLVMLDEASRCKNTQAVVTKRIGYYLKDCRRGYSEVLVGDGPKKVIVQKPLPENLKPKVLILSGTVTNRSIKDYWHMLKWALPQEHIPLPIGFAELEQWSLALDVKVGELQRVKPGALLELCNEEEKELAKTNPLKAARRAFRRRLLDTPGIVSTQTPFLGSSLGISARMVEPPPEVRDAFMKLRKNWETPDGWDIQDAHIAAMHAKELALGFYYRWNPRPPEEYMEARREWGRTCRKIISRNRRRIDSEGQVIQAVTEGLYPHAEEALDDWLYWKNEFTPETEAVWVHDYALKFATQWMKDHPSGIVWTLQSAFGKKLSEYSGISYYGEGSVDANGRFVESHPHGTPMICSISANYMGKNLQYGWYENLIMAALSSGEWYEQLLGRTHRDEQPEDLVTAEVFVSCLEHLRAFWGAVEDAEFAEDMESPRKLLYADVTVPTLESVSMKDGVFWKEGNINEVST